MKNWLMVALIAICAPAFAGEEPSLTSNEAAAAKEVADRITAYAAGYCKGLADKHGVDFFVCFKQATDYAIAKLEELRIERKRD